MRTWPKRGYEQQNVHPRIAYPSILEENIVIYQISYFSDTASIEKHFYVGFQEYLMLGRENGTKTCLRTTTTRIVSIVEALTSEEIIVIYQTLYFSDTASIEEHFYIDFQEYLMLGRENGTKTCLRRPVSRYRKTEVTTLHDSLFKTHFTVLHIEFF